MSTSPTSPEFEMSGGALCLDFANTLGDRPRSSQELLEDYGDLIRFAHQAGIVTAKRLGELDRGAREHPRKAGEVFRRALEVRETLFRVFSGLACGEAPGEEDLQLLNSALHRSLDRLQLRARGKAIEWAWNEDTPSLEAPIWPIVRSAAELLTSEEASSVRECDSETCSWLFIDRSRTKQRRWCDMSTCGNRAKARRHYQRRKQGRSSS